MHAGRALSWHRFCSHQHTVNENVAPMRTTRKSSRRRFFSCLLAVKYDTHLASLRLLQLLRHQPRHHCHFCRSLHAAKDDASLVSSHARQTTLHPDAHSASMQTTWKSLRHRFHRHHLSTKDDFHMASSSSLQLLHSRPHRFRHPSR